MKFRPRLEGSAAAKELDHHVLRVLEAARVVIDAARNGYVNYEWHLAAAQTSRQIQDVLPETTT